MNSLEKIINDFFDLLFNNYRTIIASSTTFPKTKLQESTCIDCHNQMGLRNILFFREEREEIIEKWT